MQIPEEIEGLREQLRKYAAWSQNPDMAFGTYLTKEILFQYQIELLHDMEADKENPDQSLNQVRAQLFQEIVEQVGYEFVEYLEKKAEREAQERERGPLPPLDEQELMMLSRAYTIWLEGEEYCFCPEHLRAEDGQGLLRLVLSKDDMSQRETLEFRGPLSEDGSILRFQLKGQPMTCQFPLGLIRWTPSYDSEKGKEMARGVTLLDEAVIRVDRGLAERSLTPEALELAFHSDAAYFYWSIPDGRYACLFFDLPAYFESDNFAWVQDQVGRYCQDYLEKVCGQSGLDPILQLDRNMDRLPVFPEDGACDA